MIKISIVGLLFCCALLHVVNAQTESASFAYYCPPCGSHCDKLVFDSPGTCSHCGMALVRQTKQEKALSSKPPSVCFYLQDGVEVLDFAGPMEVFASAGFEVFTVSKKREQITSQGILRIVPEYDIENAPAADILAVFGGNTGVATNDKQVIAWIKQQAAKADHIFSVCTGAFILGEAGLLDNQVVTTFHLSIEKLKKQVPKAKVLSDVRFVDNGKVITTAGISAGIDGALHLVSKLRGESSAKASADYMEYDKWIPGEGKILTHK